MKIKEKIIYDAFRQVNGFKPLAENCDTFAKLHPDSKQMIKQGTPAYKLAKLKR